MSAPLRIYVAGPLSAPTDVAMQRNVGRAVAVGASLIMRGHYPLVPHLTYYLDLELKSRGHVATWEEWLRLDEAWLEHADALFYIQSSPGADRELALATERGLPVYRSLSAVPLVRRGAQGRPAKAEDGVA